jgi:hypothetical protein
MASSRSRITQLENRIDNLHSLISILADGLSAAERRIESLEGQYQFLDISVDSLSGRVSTLSVLCTPTPLAKPKTAKGDGVKKTPVPAQVGGAPTVLTAEPVSTHKCGPNCKRGDKPEQVNRLPRKKAATKVEAAPKGRKRDKNGKFI